MNNYALTFIGRQTQDWPHGYRPDSLWQATLAHNTSICQAFGDRVVLSPHKRVHFLSFPSPLLSTSGISKGLNSIWKKVLRQKTTSISDTFIRKSVETHVRQAEPKARDAWVQDNSAPAEKANSALVKFGTCQIQHLAFANSAPMICKLGTWFFLKIILYIAIYIIDINAGRDICYLTHVYIVYFTVSHRLRMCYIVKITCI